MNTHTKGQRRAIGYVRISKQRGEETSTTTQEQAIRAYCTAMAIEVVDVIVEAGRSAFKESRSTRPGMARAMALIEAGAADTFIVWKVDRASRNTEDLLKLVRQLGEHDATFASVTEHFDTGKPMGKAMLTLVAALAELESGQKSERTTAWHEHRRAIGATPSTRPVRGYHKPSRNVLAIHPSEGPLIREAFERVAAGASVRSTVRWLGGEGITITPRGLVTCLTSPTIAGLVDQRDGTFGDGAWPALVAPEAWEMVRAYLRDPYRTTNQSGGERRFALVGIATCACGGGSMRGKDHPKGPRLICGRCNTGIPYAATEAFVDDYVLSKLDDATWKALRIQGRVPTADAAAIQARIDKLRAFSDDEAAWGESEVEAFRVMIAELEGQLAASEGVAVVLPLVESVRESWSALTVNQRRLVYLAAVRSLVIGPATVGARAVDHSRIALDLTI